MRRAREQTIGKQPKEINTGLAQIRHSFLHVSVVPNRGDGGARGAQLGFAQKQQGHRGASGGQTSSSSPVCRGSVGRRAGLGASHGTGFRGNSAHFLQTESSGLTTRAEGAWLSAGVAHWHCNNVAVSSKGASPAASR